MLAFYSHMRALPRNSLLKLPKQARSIETVHAILDAGVKVLVEDGAVGFTTNRVAEVAGISPGSLYQYFANGEMILTAMIERGVLDAEELLRVAFASTHEQPLDAMLRAALVAVFTHMEPYAHVVGQILEAAPLLAQNGITTVLETRILDAVREAMIREPGRYRFSTSSATLYVAVNGVLFVGLKWLVDRPPHVSREALVAAIVEMVRGAIETEERRVHAQAGPRDARSPDPGYAPPRPRPRAPRRRSP